MRHHLLSLFVISVAWFVMSRTVVYAQQPVPALSGRIVDEAGLLAPSVQDELAALLAAHEEETSNQVAVLTVPDLGGESVEDFSMRVVESWQLGQADKDNGILILVARDDREMRIEVGQGLEGDLPDVLAGRIIRNEFIPAFRNGDFESGIVTGTNAVLMAIEGAYVADEGGSLEDDLMGRLLFGGIFYSVVSVFVFVAMTAPLAGRIFLFIFLLPFVGAPAFVVTGSGGGVLIALILYAVIFWTLAGSKWARERRKKSGSSGWFGSGGGSGGGWSSSSGGFSGGGGSFGGGGASGSW